MRVVGVEPIEDGTQHGIRLSQSIAVTETQDMKTGRVQDCCALGIGANRLGFEVLAAVQFDNQSAFKAGEVSEVAVYRMLPPELPSAELSISQTLPQLLFCIRRSTAQLARPHPNPLPHAGEGTERGLALLHSNPISCAPACRFAAFP